MMNDHTGKTWAEIVGETSKKRIVAKAMATREVDAASIAGMTLTHLDWTDPPKWLKTTVRK